MTLYAGLDVGEMPTDLCVVNCEGGIVWCGACATDTEVVALTLRRHGAGLARAVLETDALSGFLHHGLIEGRVPVAFTCARLTPRTFCPCPATRATHSRQPLIRQATVRTNKAPFPPSAGWSGPEPAAARRSRGSCST